MVQAWVWTAPIRTVAQMVRQQEVGRRTGREDRIREDRVGVHWSRGHLDPPTGHVGRPLKSF